MNLCDPLPRSPHLPTNLCWTSLLPGSSGHAAPWVLTSTHPHPHPEHSPRGISAQQMASGSSQPSTKQLRCPCEDQSSPWHHESLMFPIPTPPSVTMTMVNIGWLSPEICPPTEHVKLPCLTSTWIAHPSIYRDFKSTRFSFLLSAPQPAPPKYCFHPIQPGAPWSGCPASTQDSLTPLTSATPSLPLPSVFFLLLLFFSFSFLLPSWMEKKTKTMLPGKFILFDFSWTLSTYRLSPHPQLIFYLIFQSSRGSREIKHLCVFLEAL